MKNDLRLGLIALLCMSLGYTFAGTFVPPTFQYDGWNYVDGKSIYLYTFTSGTSPAISHSGLQGICFTSNDLISVEFFYNGAWHNSSWEVITKVGPNDPECLEGFPALKFDDGFPDYAVYQYRLTLDGYFPPTNGWGWWKGSTTGDCFEITIPGCELTPNVPKIDIEKHTNGEDADSPTGPNITVGGVVTWEYLVTNPGNVPLSDIVVSDDQGVTPVYQSGDANSDGKLDVTETWVYQAVGTAVAGQYANIGKVTGKYEGQTVSDEDPSHYYGADPKIDIEKHTNDQDADTPTGPMITVGGEVIWTYIVTNPGNVPLSDIVVTDDQGVTPVYKEGDTNSDNLLDVTETWIYEAKGTASLGQYANVGTVTGKYEGQTVSDEDPSHYYGTEKPTQKLIIKKTIQGPNPWPAKFNFQIIYPDGSTEDVVLNLNVGTDVQHQKQFSTMPGKHIVTEADLQGYKHISETTVEVEVPEGGEATAAFVNMTARGCAEGFVYENGKPAAGVVVRLETEWLKKAEKHPTDQNGHYYFGDVIIGIEYTLSVPSLGMSTTFTLETTDNGCFYYDFFGGGCNPVLAWYEGWYSGPNGQDPLRYWSPNNYGGTEDEPNIGEYDSYDMDIWEYHILLAWACDIDAFVVDWYGKDAYEQTPTKGLLDAAQRLYEKYGHLGFDFRIIVSYNENALGTIEENLQFINENVLVHPAYWGVREQTMRPLFVFCEKHPDCYRTFFNAAQRLLPDDVAIFANWNANYLELQPYVDGFYPWVQATNGNWDPEGKEWGEGYLEEYYQLMKVQSPVKFIGATWPGYDDRNWVFSQNRYIDRQDTLVYHWTWEDAFKHQPDWLLVESWNTFAHSTHIEVAEDIGYKFIKLTRNKAVRWKSACARRVEDLGLLVPESVWHARKRPLTDDLIDNALVQFFLRNYADALGIVNMQNAPSPTPSSQERDARLVFVEGSPSHSKESWDNAVDGDGEGWDGTATAKYLPDGGTFAVFRFADNGAYLFNTVYFQTDNGADDDKCSTRQATDIEVLVSTSGFSSGDFVSIARIKPVAAGMTAYPLGRSVVASFIKIVVHGPNCGQGGWVQVVEFAVGNGSVGNATPMTQTIEFSPMPTQFELQQNYPNPFNPTTTIGYALPEDAEVTLSIFDLNGRELCQLVNGAQKAGYHSVVWNATGYPSGLYYYRLQAGTQVATKRLVILK